MEPEQREEWGYGEYEGGDCENCGRQRILRFLNGRRICEKCNWDQDLHDYPDDHERIG